MRWHRGMFFMLHAQRVRLCKCMRIWQVLQKGKKITIFAPLFTTFVIKFVKY